MRRSDWLTWSLLALTLGACTSVIGIEELEEGPKPGGSSSGGRAEAGGRDGSGGRSEGAGTSTGGALQTTGGRVATGGSSAGGAKSTGGSPEAAGESPVGASGEGGEGGSGEAVDGEVRGKVIDFWGRPVPGVPIGIGELTTATQNDGTFTLAEVTPPYDVSLVVDNGRINYAWVYQGVSRLDPTLQVNTGLSERGNTTTFYSDNAMFGGENVVAIALGGPDSSFFLRPSGGQLTTFPSWSGPASVEVTGHGLWWTETDMDTMPGPATFESYGETEGPVQFVDAMPTDVRIDLSPTAVPSVPVQGTVTRTIADSPKIAGYVRFDDNAVIELFNESADGSNFAFTAPDLPNATVIAVGSHGDVFSGPYGVAAEAYDGGSLAISPPEAVALISPVSDAVDVGPNTTFEWTEKPGARVLHIEDNDFYQGIYVVTMDTKITLPEVVGGFKLRANAVHVWTVETHGRAENMDEVTGPEGFLDPLSDDREAPRGPKHGSPAFSFSQRRAFQTAP